MINFNSYSIAGYSPPRPLTISWSVLKPDLDPRLPFDPAALETPNP